MRRIYLDLTGRIPSSDDVRAFLDDSSPNKRQALIDKLLYSSEFNDRWTMWMGDLLLYHAGTPQPFDPATASAYLKKNRDVQLRLRFTLGPGRCTFYTCDLTHDYVRLNAEYTT